jgi:hypothetical protein
MHHRIRAAPSQGEDSLRDFAPVMGAVAAVLRAFATGSHHSGGGWGSLERGIGIVVRRWPMGFFDKVKTFATGASTCAIEVTSIERQPPATATMPLQDSVIKGQYRIVAQRDCTVLAHRAELRTRCKAKDGTLGTGRARNVNDAKNQVIGAPYQFPYEMKAGDVMESGFIMTGLDLPSYYAAYGVASKDPSVEVLVKISIDVQGSPFDPSVEALVRIV